MAVELKSTLAQRRNSYAFITANQNWTGQDFGVGDIWTKRGTFLSMGNRLHLQVQYSDSLNVTAGCYDGACGRVYHLAAEPVVIQSENYPGDYENFWDCIYFVQSSAGGNVRVFISHLDLEDGYDFLKLGYGGNASNPASVIKSLTGSTANTTIIVNSTFMWLWFKSDSSGTATGYHLKVSSTVLPALPDDFNSSQEMSISFQLLSSSPDATSVSLLQEEQSARYQSGTEENPESSSGMISEAVTTNAYGRGLDTTSKALLSVTGVLFLFLIICTVGHLKRVCMNKNGVDSDQITHTYIGVGGQMFADTSALDLKRATESTAKCSSWECNVNSSKYVDNEEQIYMDIREPVRKDDTQVEGNHTCKSNHRHGREDMAKSEDGDGYLVPYVKSPEEPVCETTSMLPHEMRADIYQIDHYINHSDSGPISPPTIHLPNNNDQDEDGYLLPDD